MSDYSEIKPSTLGIIKRYISHGTPPGEFLTAVLENDLSEAFGRADEENSAAMRSIVGYLYNNAPARCWGSPERVRDWLRSKRDDHNAYLRSKLSGANDKGTGDVRSKQDN